MNFEDELKKALKSNDEDYINSIFEEIYYAYSKLVYFIISKYIANRMDIEELTNDVFLNFFNHLDKNEFKNIKYYLMTSAKNSSLNFLKKRKLDTINCEIEQVYFESSSEYNEIIEMMKSILQEKEIDIIIDHHFFNLSFSSIASQMDTSVNTVKSIYRRAIKKFQEKYKGR